MIKFIKSIWNKIIDLDTHKYQSTMYNKQIIDETQYLDILNDIEIPKSTGITRKTYIIPVEPSYDIQHLIKDYQKNITLDRITRKTYIDAPLQYWIPQN